MNEFEQDVISRANEKLASLLDSYMEKDAAVSNIVLPAIAGATAGGLGGIIHSGLSGLGTRYVRDNYMNNGNEPKSTEEDYLKDALISGGIGGVLGGLGGGLSGAANGFLMEQLLKRGLQ